jgi:uncharacterized glyoxalase superfamily protein PhnB
LLKISQNGKNNTVILRFYAPVIFVEDIHISKNFYQDIMAQEVEYDFGSNIIFKSRLSLWQIRKEHEIIKIARSSKSGNAFELYFETEDISEYYDRIRSTGVSFLHELKTEPWGQQTFRLFDPDHHLIEIGESMNTFVMRIYKQSGSLAKTSGITGIPAEVIKAIAML